MNKRTLIFLALVLLAVCALPLLVSNYRVFQFTLVLVYAIALLGLNLLTGYNGQISLGHGAFYAIGAYCAAILMDKFGMPYWATLPAAGAVCLVVGFLFGLPALRLEGLYLALATFALGVSMPQLLKYHHLEKWTGGVQGIVIVKPDPPFGLPLNPDQWLYYFTLAVMILMFVLAWNLLRGRVGRALIAIRDHHTAAEAMGVNTALYKSLTFGVSAMYTGIAGALGAIAVQFVAPDSFNIFLSITFLVGIVIGGLASIPGAIYGALFIQFVPNIADEISKAAPWAIFGIFMIGFVYVMPFGVAGAIRMGMGQLQGETQNPRILTAIQGVLHMNGILKSGIIILVVSGAATIWGAHYRSNHGFEGAIGSIIEGVSQTYTIAGWALGLGVLGFLVGIGVLVAGLVNSGRPPK
jgi:branched-chain amino acid transport system permease protein